MGKTRTFGIIGLSTFGGTIGQELTRFENHVIGIDVDERQVMRWSDTISHAMIADGRDETALRDAGFANCDVAIVALASDLEASILAAMNLKLLGVPVVWAKARTKTHHRILSRIGVDRVVHPEAEVGQHVAQALNMPQLRDYASLGNGFHVATFRLAERLEGQRIGDFRFGDFSLRLMGAMRGTEFLEAAPDLEVQQDDLLMVLGQRKDLTAFGETL